MAATFENVREADQIGVDIGVRIDQRMAHAGLRREMDDIAKPMLGEVRRHARAVGEIELDEREARQPRQFGQARVLQLGVVVGVEIVETDHRAAVLAADVWRRGNR